MVDDAMLLCESPRPDARPHVFQRLGLPDPPERGPHDGFHHVQKAKGYTPFRINPVTKVLAKLRLEDRNTRCGRQLPGLLQTEFLPERSNRLRLRFASASAG